MSNAVMPLVFGPLRREGGGDKEETTKKKELKAKEFRKKNEFQIKRRHLRNRFLYLTRYCVPRMCELRTKMIFVLHGLSSGHTDMLVHRNSCHFVFQSKETETHVLT